MQVTRVHLLLFATLFLQTYKLEGSFEYQGAGWSAASANIGMVGRPNLDRAPKNPALLPYLIKPEFSLNYATPYWGLDLHSGEFAFVLEWNNQPLVGEIAYLGDQVYSEKVITLGTATTLDTVLVAGFTCQVYQVSISDLYTRSTISFSPSFSFMISPKVQLGSRIHNLVQVKKRFMVPQRFNFGLAYLSENMQLMIQVEKESAHPPELCFGLEWQINPYFHLACGFRDESKSLSCGWKIDLKPFSMHYSFVFHPELPSSHGLGVGLEF